MRFSIHSLHTRIVVLFAALLVLVQAADHARVNSVQTLSPFVVQPLNKPQVCSRPNSAFARRLQAMIVQRSSPHWPITVHAPQQV